MKRFASMLLLVSLLLPAVASADVDTGDKPTYAAKLLDGEDVSSEQLRGKVVLVDFWATWCGPCKESFPFYSGLVDKYDGDLVVLAVSVDTGPGVVREFLKDKGFAFSVVWEKGHPMARTFGPSMFPTSYLIDKDGVVRHIHTGFDKDVRKKTAAEVEALIRR